MSNYLSKITDVNIRRKFTKLRLGCTKMKTHLFLNDSSLTDCPLCKNNSDNNTHLLFGCSEFNNIRNKYLSEIESNFIGFGNFWQSETRKTRKVLTLNFNNDKLIDSCIQFINEIYDAKFK